MPDAVLAGDGVDSPPAAVARRARGPVALVGSDDHAVSTANLLSMIASAKLHDRDPEEYLRDLFRVLPHWPEGRYLELAAKSWRATRARLDPVELDLEIGWLRIPAPADPR